MLLSAGPPEPPHTLTLAITHDYNDKVLSARGGAGQRVGIKNRPAGLNPLNHTESHSRHTTVKDHT